MKKRIELGMGLNLLLLFAMAATNIFSLYHLSSSPPPPPSLNLNPADPIPSHLLHHPRHHLPPHPPPLLLLLLLRRHHPSLLYSAISPIASACSDHPDLLHRYMSYTPFSPCPNSHPALAESLILRGCHPLPRRRCFSSSPSPGDAAPVSDGSDSARLLSARSALDLTLPQLLAIAKAAPGAAPIRLGLDIGGGAAALAAKMKALANATILTTTLDLGRANSLTAAGRGLAVLHAPLQQRFPVPDGAMDLVRAGHAVNRWIPAAAMEFLLYDADRVLRGGGLLWVDHFFCRGGDLAGVYAPMIGKLGYKRIKWAVGNKTDAGGIKYGEVYLTALLQKPVAAAA